MDRSTTTNYFTQKTNSMKRNPLPFIIIYMLLLAVFFVMSAKSCPGQSFGFNTDTYRKVCVSEEPIPLFNVFVNDSLCVEAIELTTDNLKELSNMEKHYLVTTDGIAVCLYRNRYCIFLPDTKTKYVVTSFQNKPVNYHLVWFIQEIRKWRALNNSITSN